MVVREILGHLLGHYCINEEEVKKCRDLEQWNHEREKDQTRTDKTQNVLKI